jgi:hypothetical protein
MSLQVILLLIMLSVALSFNNKLIKMKLNNIAQNNIINPGDNSNEVLIKMMNGIDDVLYTVIWNSSQLCDDLLNDMNNHNLHTLFIEKNSYNKKELAHIIKICNDPEFNFEKEPWIFEEETFIGGLFEIYLKMSKK